MIRAHRYSYSIPSTQLGNSKWSWKQISKFRRNIFNLSSLGFTGDTPTSYTKNGTSLWVAVAVADDIKLSKLILEHFGLFDRRRKIVSFAHVQRAQPPTSIVPFKFVALIPIMRPFNCSELYDESSTESTKLRLGVDESGRLRRSQNFTTESKNSIGHLTGHPCFFNFSTDVIMKLSKVQKSTTQETLVDSIRRHIHYHFASLSSHLSDSLTPADVPIPNRWERLGHFALFPEDSFGVLSAIPLEVSHNLWKDVAESLRCVGIGIRGRIRGDMRESQV